jgi:hypothetical protein
MRRSHLVLIVGLGLLAGADNAKPKDARRTTEEFLTAALAGKVEDAVALAEKDHVSERQVRKLKNLLAAKAVALASARASEKGNTALVITEEVWLTKPNPDGQDTGRLLLTLTRKGGRWLVRDIDFRSEAKTKEAERRFLKKFPDAKPVGEKAGK